MWKWIISWFGVGIICALIGTLFDYLTYNKKPSKKILDYIWYIFCGYISYIILMKVFYDWYEEKHKRR